MLNSTFSGLKRCRCWQYVSKLYLHLFSSCCHPNLRNSAKIRTYSSSRSSKVIDLDANRKRICNFLLTLDVYPNFFEILTFKAIDNGWFSSPSLLVWRTRLRQPVRISADETYPAKTWCIVSTVWWQESPAIADKPARRESLLKLLQFDVLTTLSLTILAYLHAFNCYCVRNPRNPVKFTENSNLRSSRSSKVIDIVVNRKPICDLLLVINSNFSRVCYRFPDIHG